MRLSSLCLTLFHPCLCWIWIT